MGHVLVLGPNPAIQKVVKIGGPLVPGSVNRATSSTTGVGGKGQNVAVALNMLGVSTVLAQFGGGDETGAKLMSLLPCETDPNMFHVITSPTSTPVRTCTTILSSDGATEVIEPTGAVTPEDIDCLLSRLSGLHPRDVLVLMGSIPPKAGVDFYSRVAVQCVAKRTRVVADIAARDQLDALLAACPPCRSFTLKCNVGELRKITCLPDSDLHDVVKAAFTLSPKLSNVALTDGGGSAYYADSAGAFKTISPPPVEAFRSPIGAGDCVAAGLACALSRGEESVEKAFVYGLAVGAASCQQESSSGFDAAYLAKLTSNKA
mmetsp:Transcript_11507/g.22939  ORF Transcript_11507/g.22939 Transcript_11507/m.22939 type:complete len:318 (-) Transcript_11507:42-995(-)